ncbi:MAG TPA: Rne/Rng family ribonuclease, partial [Gemmataceae bacterium]
MLINVLQPEECRIAVIEDGVLEELYVERTSQESLVGNIYKGKIVNIEPSIQAAFVDFGIGRNGFLHVSDVDPAYYRHLEGYREEGNGRAEVNGRRPRRDGERRGERRDGRPPRGERAERPAAAEEEPAGREMTAWLPPEEAPPAEGFGAGLDLPEEPFGAGLDLDEPAAAPAAQPPAAGGEVPPEAGGAADEGGAAAAAAENAEAGPAARKGRRRRGRGGRGERARAAEPPAGDAEPAPAEPESAAAAEPAPPEAAAPEGEAPAAKGGRRRRPSRRRKSAAAAQGEEAAGPGEEAAGPESAGPEPGDEGPRLMGSAERRTSGDEPEIEPPLATGVPPEPGQTGEGEESDFGEDHPAPPGEGGDLPESLFSDEAARGLFVPPEAEAGYDAGAGAPEEDYGAEGYGASAEAPPGWGDAPAEAHEPRGDEEFFEAEEEEEPGRERGRARGRGRERGRNRRPLGRDGGRPKPLIQDIFKRGQEVIVQVIKEPLGTKGPTLSTYISIPGRYLVLMPGLNRIGVSRKIEDAEARGRLREILGELKPPKGLGFIIRTAGQDRNKKELQNDLAYLLRLWQVVVRRIRRAPAPVEAYRESDMVTRTIRDIFTGDIDTVWIDEADAHARAAEFTQAVMPRYANRLRYYDSTEPLFHKYGIEQELAKINQKTVPLPKGGSIVIEQTEALVAIDVNSGSYRAESGSAEDTAYEMNLLAAKEIARQLRLRDLGGVIVNDFIDMREEKHRRGVEKAMREAVRRDRARTKILKISPFGIIEMTRQRIRTSLHRSTHAECPHCSGSGRVKTAESMSIE